MLRLASDANVRGEIVRGLRRRLAEIDLVQVQEQKRARDIFSSLSSWCSGQQNHNQASGNPIMRIRSESSGW